MTNRERISEIGDKLVEKTIKESKYTSLFDIRYIFPIVSLKELKSMNRDKKISFLFKYDDPTLKQFVTKRTLSIIKSVAILLLGLFIISTIVFSFYYSIKYSEYLVLISLPLIYVALASTTPYKNFKTPVLILSIVLLTCCFFITNTTLIILIIVSSVTNILTNLVRKINQINLTDVILNNEVAFVKGYVNNSFSIKNEKNKAILFNTSVESLQKLMLREFEDGLSA